MGSRMTRAAVPAVLLGLTAGAVALAPAAQAAVSSVVNVDFGCSPVTLGRGATVSAAAPASVIHLSGPVTGLVPHAAYTYLVPGSTNPIGELSFTPDAHGAVYFTGQAVALSRPVTSFAGLPYEIRDAAGTKVSGGTSRVAIRPGDGCLVLTRLDAGAYRLVLQDTDGNLVERDAKGRAVWATGTYGHPGATAALQTDGNFVIRDRTGRAIWTTGTNPAFETTMTLQSDSNFVLRSSTGQPLWVTGIHR